MLQFTGYSHDSLRQSLVGMLFVSFIGLMVGCTPPPPPPPPATSPTTEASSVSTTSAAALERFRFSHPQMGTRFNVTVYAASQLEADAGVIAAFDRIDELNAALSDYLVDSAVSELSKSSGSGEVVVLDADLLAVLKRAAFYSELSGGSFDVTVGPYTRLWRRARAMGKLPSEARLAEARAAVGYALIDLDAEGGTAELTATNMRLDLGAIAKGYAADEALKVLREHGLGVALIDAGGDVTLGDAPPGREGWRVAIEPLLDENYEPREITKGADGDSEVPPYLTVSNASVATSGDAFQHVVIEGVRYSHIVNPKTGIGLTRAIGVSVVAGTGMDADAIASMVSVLGPVAGLKLVEGMADVHALVLTLNEKDEVEIYTSADFPK